MNAEYVAVSPAELDDLRTDPSGVLDVFPLEGIAGLGASASASAGPGRRRLSIDKAWHGVHFLLTGTADEPDDTVGEVGAVVLGGEELGEDEGYGPARVFPAAVVARLADALDQLDLDAVGARYDGARMTELAVYPGGWEVDAGAQAWLLDALRDLRAFFRACADDGSAVVTLLT